MRSGISRDGLRYGLTEKERTKPSKKISWLSVPAMRKAVKDFLLKQAGIQRLKNVKPLRARIAFRFNLPNTPHTDAIQSLIRELIRDGKLKCAGQYDRRTFYILADGRTPAPPASLARTAEESSAFFERYKTVRDELLQFLAGDEFCDSAMNILGHLKAVRQKICVIVGDVRFFDDADDQECWKVLTDRWSSIPERREAVTELLKFYDEKLNEKLKSILPPVEQLPVSEGGDLVADEGGE